MMPLTSVQTAVLYINYMLNVFALLLDDALLKCVVTDIVSFSVVAFKTPIFHKVV